MTVNFIEGSSAKVIEHIVYKCTLKWDFTIKEQAQQIFHHQCCSPRSLTWEKLNASTL